MPVPGTILGRMSQLPDTFPAFVAERDGDDVTRGLRELPPADLGEGDVTIRVAYSSVNYKDALATISDGKVARISPLVPGVDLAGTVVEGPGQGDEVIVHGHDLGVAHHGGFAAYARVPSAWVVPLPAGLDVRQAMAIGTAGFTSALSVVTLEDRGMRPGDGPVLVTGASGGVGSTAVGMLGARGYEVIASTGKVDAHDYLRRLGAADVIAREEVVGDKSRPLGKERWAGAIDCVGGSTLAGVVKTLRYGAAVAASGNTGGPTVSTTVFPFILRAVALLGIDSVNCPSDLRRRTWQRLADDLRPTGLDDAITREITLDELDEALTAILDSASTGRTVVRLT
jgi:acrylyl-CoA reductase (NADPH)